MYKILKYLLFVGLYKKAKRYFYTLLALVITLVLINLILSDAIDVSTNVTVYLLLIVKWIANLSILGVLAFNILKIINIATNPFSKNKTGITKPLVKKKNRILNKEIILTQSDLIMKKYMKEKQ